MVAEENSIKGIQINWKMETSPIINIEDAWYKNVVRNIQNWKTAIENRICFFKSNKTV